MSLETVKDITAKRLHILFQNKTAEANAIDIIYGQLLDELDQFMARGGKRIRPYLTYLGYTACRGQNVEAILDAAISQELYHTYFVIHDDIIDRDIKRWGGPNISGVYTDYFSTTLASHQARHYGDAIAILAGDILSGLAADVILQSDFGDRYKLAAMKRMQQMIFEIGAGEQIDVVLPILGDNEITKDRLLTIAKYKTASYSFEATLQLGAILAGASPATVRSLSGFAVPVGIAYQLRDDYLALYGNENELGKPTLSDLREGKRTLLIEYALELAAESDRDELLGYLGNSRVSYTHLGRVREIVETCGAKLRITATAQDYVDKAKSSLDNIDLDPDTSLELRKLASMVINRKS